MTAAALVASLGLYLGAIQAEAVRAGVDADLLAVICHFETRGEAVKHRAVGADGERGVCQVKPATAVEMGVAGNLGAPDQRANARAGARWLAHCVARGATALREMAHCYNAGLIGAGKTPYAQRVADAVTALRMEAAMRNQVAAR